MKDDSVFRESLERSRVISDQVLNWLKSIGHHVTHLPQSTTPDRESRWQHTDQGDLVIRQRIEVKHWPNIDFKSFDDVPYDNIIVDEAYKIQKPGGLSVHSYVIVNASADRAIIILSTTKKHWFTETKWDRMENSQREFCFCPKEHCIIVRLLPPQALGGGDA